jgi:esterase/lipase superfamily enzyme
MRRDIRQWWSPSLNKNMEIVAYGHFGTPILLFPTAAADYLEYERFYLIDSIKSFINEGRIKVYSINSINSESWLNSRMHARDKAVRHQQYNEYIANEVVPFIWNDCGGQVGIITAGASLGAFHGANTLFRRPDLFDGTIAMSGTYNLMDYTNGYFDDNCYFNSPMHYMKNLQSGTHLDLLRSKKHIYFLTGSGSYEAPQCSWDMANVLGYQGIPNFVEMWGKDWTHDWPTWRAMLPKWIATHF